MEFLLENEYLKVTVTDWGAQVKSVVKAQRQENVEKGKTYREDDVIILDASSTDHEELQIQGVAVCVSKKLRKVDVD